MRAQGGENGSADRVFRYLLVSAGWRKVGRMDWGCRGGRKDPHSLKRGQKKREGEKLKRKLIWNHTQTGQGGISKNWETQKS